MTKDFIPAVLNLGHFRNVFVQSSGQRQALSTPLYEVRIDFAEVADHHVDAPSMFVLRVACLYFATRSDPNPAATSAVSFQTGSLCQSLVRGQKVQ